MKALDEIFHLVGLLGGIQRNKKSRSRLQIPPIFSEFWPGYVKKSRGIFCDTHDFKSRG